MGKQCVKSMQIVITCEFNKTVQSLININQQFVHIPTFNTVLNRFWSEFKIPFQSGKK